MRFSVYSLLLTALLAQALASAAPPPASPKPATPTARPVKKPLPPPPKAKPKPPSEADLRTPFLAAGGPMKDAADVVFAVRKPFPTDGHWYANFGYYAMDSSLKVYTEGAKLCRLNLRTGQLKVLLDDPRGGVRDPQVHYDGRKILFSYRKGGSDYYHLHEINVDGTGLRQITGGEFDDFEPTYLPDGDIVFVSSRCKRWVNCWLTQVAVLYRCDGDGRNIHPISSNNEHDNTPWPLPDGRILYTRWEYVDRSQVHYHHLWVVNPDGSSQMTYFGNLHAGTTMIDAKPIPGTDKIVAGFSPGHGRREHAGVITVVDPNAGPDDQARARTIHKSANFRDPWAFSEKAFMAAEGNRLVLLDDDGRTQTVYRLGEDDSRRGMELHEPRPLVGRPRETVIAPRVQPGQATGRLVLADVTNGRNMDGVRKGQIKKLLVLETLPKPINYTGGMEPLSYGGTFTLERILGTVPVEPDGSAYFEVPAMRSVFFVALDENDMSVKRMQSFVTVQPGETTGCVGCHEHRVKTPAYAATSVTQAMRRPPSRIEPITDVPDVLDFPRDIQPILNRHCLPCHGIEKRCGGVLLTADRGVWYSHSYYNLFAFGQVADGRNRPVSNYAPGTLGSSASPLMHKLLSGHHKVKVSPAELKTVRLWIDSGAAYPGTYAALGCGMIGGNEHNKPDLSSRDWPAVKTGAEAAYRRCAPCHDHKGPRGMAYHFVDHYYASWKQQSQAVRHAPSRHIMFNLTRPDKSLMVLAPLARSAGGYGLCQAAPGTPPQAAKSVVPGGGVFANTNDADYRKILAMIQAGKDHLDKIKRFDMPGFRPRDAWVREMKKYRILPKDLPADAPIDYYAAERKYWQSLWYTPPELSLTR
ncbi:MAG: translocation protein TolB [Planctomycetes bacterium ADurb.Bin126]|nr:MAG: translocation protein TolB [Planctomycetes bacterium ADurb.Bin126]HOD82507.1 hypothetical protein [Phycisphaerae bacterium]HQL74459.1 hypothetical protein [Phycisphaerae bacterium]